MKYLGDLEQAISEKMSDFFEKEMGLRPTAVRTAIQGDLIIIRFENALSPSEINLIGQETGRQLIKELHEKISDQIFPGLRLILRSLSGIFAVGLHIELYEHSREKVFFINMERPLEKLA